MSAEPRQTATELARRIDELADAAYAGNLAWFFKTGPGDYGEGDVFAGVRMPQIRRVCREFRELPLSEIEKLLAGAVHEHRMAALVTLADRAKRAAREGDRAAQAELYHFYLGHTERINNWDLVDCSCRDVVGEHLLATANVGPLLRLARSDDLWERRIAIVSTAAFIRAGRPETAFEIAATLLDDEQDLIHKAVGWMLREAGKRDAGGLRAFLTQYAAVMPRTALRYAIEHLPADERKGWLAVKRRTA